MVQRRSTIPLSWSKTPQEQLELHLGCTNNESSPSWGGGSCTRHTTSGGGTYSKPRNGGTGPTWGRYECMGMSAGLLPLLHVQHSFHRTDGLEQNCESSLRYLAYALISLTMSDGQDQLFISISVRSIPTLSFPARATCMHLLAGQCSPFSPLRPARSPPAAWYYGVREWRCHPCHSHSICATMLPSPLLPLPASSAGLAIQQS